MLFIKMGYGSEDFFKMFEDEIVERGLIEFYNGELIQILCVFVIMDIFFDGLFKRVEEEIL